MTDKQVLLSVRDLKTWFRVGEREVRAVDGISFDIQKGETYALLGESGCGKSITSLSIMGLVPQPAGRIVSGSIELSGVDLTQSKPEVMRRIRGNRVAMIFQEPMTSLNPVFTVGQQIIESLQLHKNLRGNAARKRAIELLQQVRIPAPEARIDEYPHQLSGGMKQRVMIAIALAGEPELLIADEPTTALDVTIQAQVLQLLRELQASTGMSILLITHDLGVVAEMADRVGVMYAGQIVEQATRQQFFEQPRHPYSQKLFDSLPSLAKRGQALEVIHGNVPSLAQVFAGCRFEGRCDKAWQVCRQQVPLWQQDAQAHGVRCHLYDDSVVKDLNPPSVPQTELFQSEPVTSGQALLQVDDLKVHFPIRNGLLGRTSGYVYAVDGVSLQVPQGRTLALVGESGCGKTTVGKAILQLIANTGGRVVFAGQNLAELKGEALRLQRKDFQIIFQDPFSSMNPRMRVADIIAEGMVAQGIGGDKLKRQTRVAELLQQVGLSPEMAQRFPHEFSGGQRQRICIARALAMEPKLIVCDEPTSALDVSVQAQILNLLKELQNTLGISFLFITHNISVVAYLAHEIAVMYLGRIVERGSVDEVLSAPKHPYTQALLAAVPSVELDSGREQLHVGGDIPSPIEPPTGCHFHPRCAQVSDTCKQQYPDPVAADVSSRHVVNCHYPLK